MISEFQGKYRWLSNFWTLKVPVKFNGAEFSTVEVAYQAAKCLQIEDFRWIQQLSPGQAKRYAKGMIIRDDWNDSRKLEVMRILVYQKFYKNRELARLLVETGDQKLVEGNTWGDRFWGVCNGVGENNLGKILMEARYSLIEDFNRECGGYWGYEEERHE